MQGARQQAPRGRAVPEEEVEEEVAEEGGEPQFQWPAPQAAAAAALAMLQAAGQAALCPTPQPPA